MNYSKRGATRWPKLLNHHGHPDPQPQFLSPQSYYHIHFSSQCPVHDHLFQPHVHHHPSCPHSLSPPSLLIPHPLNTQGDDEATVEEDDEEEEPVFVLTDEWRDFFAKSEAKRKAAKKQAKKKGKQ